VRVHVVALPHTLLTRAYDWCAYTAKVRRFVGMLQAAGHTPLVYGPDVHELPDSVDYTVTVSGVDRVEWFGAGEWNTDRVFLDWNPESPPWAISNARAAAAIRRNWEPGDVLGSHRRAGAAPIVEALDDLNPLVWEWGIGYSGILNYSHKVYESYAWAHHVAGKLPVNGDDIAFFDTVIPNCFDPEDFDPRFNARGLPAVHGPAQPPARACRSSQEIAKRVPTSPSRSPASPAPRSPAPRGVRRVVTGQAKAELLAGARALLTPTTYLEPFGGVAVEAMLSGTPVIATDWGAFTETVIEGVTGYRCRTLRQFLTAVDKVGQINRHDVLAHAQERYTTDVGARLYSDALDTLGTLYGDGWYTT
jgi:hypothetical protein